ncbi:MAG: peptidase M61 [Alphaproteobacteria bacterium]|nr:MAG: peptidase M61 [Alphaproteobacteria bacterium]
MAYATKQRLAALCVAALSGTFLTGFADTPDAPDFSVVLKPVPAADGQTIDSLVVSETLAGQAVAPDSPLLELRHVTYNVTTVATSLQALEAHDDCGALALTARDTGDGAETLRQWFPDRATCGTVGVSYRVSTGVPAAARGAAPPIEIRSEAGAVSAGAASFLLRPPSGEYDVSLNWDLSALPAGAHGTSSLNTGAPERLAMQSVDSIFVMAGRTGQYPDAPTGNGFFSAWQGEPPFDGRGLMVWAETLREHFIGFFKADRVPYGVMMRRNTVNPGGGIGMHHSFVVTYDTGTDLTDLQFTLSHEMFHTYQPRMLTSSGHEEGLSLSWFNEGLAVFYQREFPFRAGMIGAGDYLRDINFHAARYYTNLLGNLPNSAVSEGFWKDTRIRTLPYDRGFLYFVTVDEALRHASGGKRSLDDLTQELRALQDGGTKLTPELWEKLLQRDLGERGVEAFRAMLAGATPLPASDAFGPCFERFQKPLRRYELGFEPAVLTEPRRIIRGLVAGSAAEAAGLQNGDEILKPVGQDGIQGDQEGILTLAIRRDGQDFSVSYLPRGETVPTWQWQRVPGVPDERCHTR